MRNKFIIDNVYAKKNKIFYEYRVEGTENFKKLFWMGELFTVEYNEEIDEVPSNILVIPLLCNILPIIWVNNATIYLKEIDYTFYTALKETKKEYKEMLPQIKFKGKIKVAKKIKNKYEKTNKVATFFSGGVDSYYTLIKSMDSKPDLVTIWGSDIDFENEKGWKVVKEYIEKIGSKYGLKNVEIKSALRRFIDNTELENQYHYLLNDNWWHAMQHGIGLIGNVAPYAFKHKISTVYIPSTPYEKKLKVVCASNPEIDNSIKFASTSIHYEEGACNRQQKVNEICDYIKEKKDEIQLRVCYRSKEGDNCSNCEKCYRTIMAIISQKIDPNNMGFEVDKQKLKQIKEQITTTDMIKNRQGKILWEEITEEFKKEKDYWEQNEDVNWILHI